jgi:hypothetical protein
VAIVYIRDEELNTKPNLRHPEFWTSSSHEVAYSEDDKTTQSAKLNIQQKKV